MSFKGFTNYFFCFFTLMTKSSTSYLFEKISKELCTKPKSCTYKTVLLVNLPVSKEVSGMIRNRFYSSFKNVGVNNKGDGRG